MKRLGKLAIFIGIGLLILFIIFYEAESKRIEISKLNKFCKILSPALWKYDQQAINSFLEFICLERGYQEIVLETRLESEPDTYRPFVRVHRNNLVNNEPIDFRSFFFNPSELESKISYNDRVIGRILISRYPPNLFTYFIVGLFLFLSFSIAFFYMEILRGKLLLEKRIEERSEALSKSEKKLEAIFENIGEGVISLDPSGKILAANALAQEMIGIFKDDLIGSFFKDILILRSFDGEPLNLELPEFKADLPLEVVTIRCQMTDSLNNERTISACLTTISNKGKLEGYVLVFRDVSNEERIEKQLRQSQKMEAVGQLAGGIAHDFNNLLQVILGYGELVEESLENFSEAEKDNWSQVMEAGKKAQSLIKKILSFSREKKEFKKGYFNLSKTVKELLKMVKRVIEENVEIVYIEIDSLWPVAGDSEQMEQALMNLCVNARDAMSHGGRLTIELKNAILTNEFIPSQGKKVSGRFVCIQISDTGSGIPPKDLERIFDPFFTTKSKGKGTGIGLATVFNIVTQHEGFLRVDSELGKGTTFRLYLPVTDVSENYEEVKPEAVDFSFEGNGETILLAEDQEEVRNLGKRLLEKNGYKVIVAENGREAIELFEANSKEIKLLLFDVVMPEMSGWEAGKAILQKKPGLPLIFCSGYTDQLVGKDIENVLIEKPYKKEILLATIRELLNKTLN